MAMLFPLLSPKHEGFFVTATGWLADEDLARRSGFFVASQRRRMCFGLMVGTPERSYDLSIFRGRNPLVSACK